MVTNVSLMVVVTTSKQVREAVFSFGLNIDGNAEKVQPETEVLN